MFVKSKDTASLSEQKTRITFGKSPFNVCVAVRERCALSGSWTRKVLYKCIVILCFSCTSKKVVILYQKFLLNSKTTAFTV